MDVEELFPHLSDQACFFLLDQALFFKKEAAYSYSPEVSINDI